MGDVSHPDDLLDFRHDEPPYSALEHFDLQVGPPGEAFTLKIKGWHEGLFVGHAAAGIFIHLPSTRMPHDFLRYRNGLLLILRLLNPELAFSSDAYHELGFQQDRHGRFSVTRLGSPQLLFVRRSWLIPDSIDTDSVHFRNIQKRTGCSSNSRKSVLFPSPSGRKNSITRYGIFRKSYDWSAFYDHADCGAHLWVCSPSRLGSGTLAEQEDWLGEGTAVDHTLSDVLSRLERRHHHALVPLMTQLRQTGERLGW
ncbi:hypothetical protein [Deinococcus multiflagellatus]|uniref:Uncharacterized protein n=1 Tax=Deinococcus multiflagellatus TaxID=1656887 RepID=A0ABW1ZPE4_9DEIO|nr:hypothetical protein [Deinococcus multiflagellatus]MBZ9714717.1 hypothetical protein [Deinococcus multiflagellatus]